VRFGHVSCELSTCAARARTFRAHILNVGMGDLHVRGELWHECFAMRTLHTHGSTGRW
jgi:hypothetical protein